MKRSIFLFAFLSLFVGFSSSSYATANKVNCKDSLFSHSEDASRCEFKKMLKDQDNEELKKAVSTLTQKGFAIVSNTAEDFEVVLLNGNANEKFRESAYLVTATLSDNEGLLKTVGAVINVRDQDNEAAEAGRVRTVTVIKVITGDSLTESK